MCDVLIDGDVADLWKEDWRTAAKEHRCSSCGATISKGERYLDHRSAYDGMFSTEKMCRPCARDRQRLVDEHPHGLIPAPSSFPEVLRECFAWEEDVRWRMAIVRLDVRISKANKDLLKRQQAA